MGEAAREHARVLARKSLAQGNVTGWFETLYVAAKVCTTARHRVYYQHHSLRSIEGWMPAYGNPCSTCYDQHSPIEVKDYHGSASRGSQASNVASFYDPLEMITPCLATRIVQWRHLIGHRIKSGDTVPFVVVTQRARQPEIVFHSGAA